MVHADDVVARVLKACRLDAPVRRLLESSPPWVARLNTRELRTRSRLVEPAVLERRFVEAIELLQRHGREIGDYLEFGVYNGTSLSCMYRALAACGIRRSRLVGFDSFEGLPAIAASDSGGHWRPGEFRSSLEFARRVLEYEGVDLSRVTLVKGFFDATLNDETRARLMVRKASLVMIDCDLYQSTAEALAFCTPSIVDECVIFFDDWFPLADKGLGERKAFEEWLSANGTFVARELFDFPFYGKAFLVSRPAMPVHSEEVRS